MTDADVQLPGSGLIAMRVGIEFGDADEFASAVQRSLARGGERGATLVAALDSGDLGIHIPREDGPCWNSVALLHWHRGEPVATADWAAANAILERLERYR
jgi:hypothetical protein